MGSIRKVSGEEAVEVSRGLAAEKRGLTRGQFLLGGITAAALAAAVAPADTAAQTATSFNLDVCWDGSLFQLDNGIAAAPKRGAAFVASGKIFPEGTFHNGPTNPSSPGSIGTWVSQGAFNLDFADIAAGKAPHAVATHFFVFDDGAMLVTYGYQGGTKTTRVVLGGAGKYLGARGSVTENEVGSNNTTLTLGPGISFPSLNSVFTFTLA